MRQLPFYLHPLRSFMPTRRTRKARGREEDRRLPLIRRRSFASTSSTKADVIYKGDKCLYSHPQKVYDARMKIRKEEAEIEIRQEGRVREVLHQLDQRRRHVGNGRKVPVHLETHANSFMQTNRHQQHLKGPARRPRRRMQPLSPLTPSSTATTKTQWTASSRVASAKKSSDSRRLSFDVNPELYKVYVEDYQEGMPKRIDRDPKKPYVFRRIEDLIDDQSKSDSALGLVRARARAIIMDTHGFHRDVDEVRIIIGRRST